MPLILIWVIAGALTVLVYVLFFVDIDSRWADHFTGYPLVYLFTIFLWPITLGWMLWSRLAPVRPVRQARQHSQENPRKTPHAAVCPQCGEPLQACDCASRWENEGGATRSPRENGGIG